MPGSLSSHILPPSLSTYAFAIDNPRPAPSTGLVKSLFALTKRSKIAFCLSLGTPIPVSLTLKSSELLKYSQPMVMLPLLEYLIAFAMKI
jgi:hypothetical protein